MYLEVCAPETYSRYTQHATIDLEDPVRSSIESFQQGFDIA